MGKAWYPFSRDARWRRVALRLGVILGLYLTLRYNLMPPDPHFTDGGWITFLVMDMALPTTMFAMVFAVILAFMSVFWARHRKRFPGFSHAANMTVTPMVILYGLILIKEINNPLWQQVATASN